MPAYDEVIYQQGEQPSLLVERTDPDLDQVIEEAQQLRNELALSASMYHELSGAISIACYLSGWTSRSDDEHVRYQRVGIAHALLNLMGYAQEYLAGVRTGAGISDAAL